MNIKIRSKKEYELFEVFNSIEGEFPKAGIFSTFVRFDTCNLDCPFCDTMKDPNKKSKKISYDSILALVKETNAITFTGGEPSLFLDQIQDIIDRLVSDGVYLNFIKIETNGLLLDNLTRVLKTKYSSIFGEKFDEIFIICWSPKLYNNKLEKKMLNILYDYYQQNTYVKLVGVPKNKEILNVFIKEFIELYGRKAFKRVSVMPLSIVTNGQSEQTFDKESIALIKQLNNDWKINIALRFHEILDLR